jgi:hypothetical protein
LTSAHGHARLKINKGYAHRRYDETEVSVVGAPASSLDGKGQTAPKRTTAVVVIALRGCRHVEHATSLHAGQRVD